MDQIATLRITVEESIVWQSPLYINLIDFEGPLTVSEERCCDSEVVAVWNSSRDSHH